MSTDDESDVVEQPWRGLGLRRGGDRRQGERRAQPRVAPDRRRAQRRRATFHSLLLSIVTLAPSAVPKRPKPVPVASRVRAAEPIVTASIENVEVVPSARAYDDLIREAAATHGVEAALIRSVIRAESGFDPLAV